MQCDLSSWNVSGGLTCFLVSPGLFEHVTFVRFNSCTKFFSPQLLPLQPLSSQRYTLIPCTYHLWDPSAILSKDNVCSLSTPSFICCNQKMHKPLEIGYSRTFFAAGVPYAKLLLIMEPPSWKWSHTSPCKINHIQISGYNSHSNGLVERPHFDVWQSLFKARKRD